MHIRLESQCLGGPSRLGSSVRLGLTSWVFRSISGAKTQVQVFSEAGTCITFCRVVEFVSNFIRVFIGNLPEILQSVSCCQRVCYIGSIRLARHVDYSLRSWACLEYLGTLAL